VPQFAAATRRAGEGAIIIRLAAPEGVASLPDGDESAA
jgi:hypothetical protein